MSAGLKSYNGVKHLVLAGGGHSHLAVLKRFGDKPISGLRITLVSRNPQIVYTGMVPGLIAGHYQYDECVIDLRRLTQYAKAEFTVDKVVGVDVDKQILNLSSGNTVKYDILSLNTGADMLFPAGHTSHRAFIPVKPVESLLAGIQTLHAQDLLSETNRPITVVGGGAGGIELLLALHYRASSSPNSERGEWHLITSNSDILPTHNRLVRSHVNRVLKSRNIRVTTNAAVSRVNEHQLMTNSDQGYDAAAVFWAAGVAAPGWICQSRLDTDHAGYININRFLQSTSHENVFAGGDIAGSINNPWPKSGVHAVRHGHTLAENLRCYILGEKLSATSTSRLALALISTGERHAIASRGNVYAAGKWLWKVKDRIDRRFIKHYTIP